MHDTKDRLSIEFICVLGMPPVDFIRLARELGVSAIGLAPQPITANPHGYPAWNLLEDAALVREARAALADNDVRVALGEGFLVRDGMDLTQFAPMLDLFADLGAPAVNAVSMAASPETFGAFAQMAGERGLRATVEFLPLMPPASFAAALDYAAACGAANAQVLVDAMHFFRGGSTVAELAVADPAKIGHVQICDVPMPARTDDYGLEAREERLAPGAGDLPLADFLKALPQGVTIGLEVPETAKAYAGIGPLERLGPVVEAARGLLARI
ncbi:sugar phosphate isomerase/epimerase family protein [Novosphingobium mangrovi (ex Huang et al. 2023)]|uniref:TIM barrel protein n=1 Tax=Novosphingobium mangrovi (ex Huang et al. 2023) TaxID=2976432 RepID=A0ABT2I890_9SPHN|nr:TIM barrel protein [Novosphingobium mangrovi (ex Huang et al. 2023)]MCT2401042.1 TIM barrel protein [Novosphingobium mangrovi (ex Huang et al. 2023)]